MHHWLLLSLALVAVLVVLWAVTYNSGFERGVLIERERQRSAEQTRQARR